MFSQSLWSQYMGRISRKGRSLAGLTSVAAHPSTSKRGIHQNVLTIRNSLLDDNGNVQGPMPLSLNHHGDGLVSPLTWYSCGPTVYDVAHLGHARTYVCQDIIRRILVDYFRIDAVFAMGITDIDDKIIDKAKSEGLIHWEQMQGFARVLEQSFFADMDRLGVARPDVVLRVTEHIDAIIAYVQGIEQKGHAYQTPDGVYFDMNSFKASSGHYGKLSSLPPQDETQEATSTIIGKSEKRNPRDFVLWKSAKPGEPSWASPWGPGRPGWHIECSAMTHSYFGERLDVHSGGVDLKFPHHTNEIAQW
jgi:cysteinyl-tRNA synthetase